MESKKLLAALLILLTAAPTFAKKQKKHKYALKGAGGQVMASGKFNESEIPGEPAAAPAPSAPDDSSISGEAGSRYTISAIEAPNEGQNYYITKDENNEFSFVQKLSWNAIPDIKNYRITIQRKQDDGSWVQVLEKDLYENKIEVSLPAGDYRFQVGVVNLFDQLEKSTEWKSLVVLKATQPKIEAMQTESLYLNSKKADGVFTLNGENLTANTKFTMEQKDSEPPKILQGTILSVSPDGNSAQVQFDIKEINEGKYEIYAQNPGGLSVISKSITIKKEKDRLWRFLISADYACPVTFFDGTFNRYEPVSYYPFSAGGRMSFVSTRGKFGNFGFGMGGYYTYFDYDKERYSMSGHYANFLGYLVYQRQLIPQRLCLEARLGVGAAGLIGVNSQNKTIFNFGTMQFRMGPNPQLFAIGIAFGGGLGIQYYPGKHFYVEANIDFVNAKFSDMNLGMFYPSLGFGGKF